MTAIRRAGKAIVLASALLAAAASSPSAQTSGGAMPAVSPAVLADLAPTGRIRASINLGNIVLAQKDPASGELKGSSVDMARELGRRLGAPVELVEFPAAGKVFDAFPSGNLDVVFLAIEPVRAKEIAFTAPYVLIEGVYMVPKNSPLKAPGDVDKPGIRIGVNRGSAYDLFLTRTLKNATLVRGPDGIQAMVKDKLDAAAGVKQALAAHAKTDPDVRLIDERFMEIRQAMGTPVARQAGAAYLAAFVEDLKANGFVAEALKRHNQPDAAVAPPAGR